MVFILPSKSLWLKATKISRSRSATKAVAFHEARFLLFGRTCASSSPSHVRRIGTSARYTTMEAQDLHQGKLRICCVRLRRERSYDNVLCLARTHWMSRPCTTSWRRTRKNRAEIRPRFPDQRLQGADGWFRLRAASVTPGTSNVSRGLAASKTVFF